MKAYKDVADFIDNKQDFMVRRIKKWARINSHSYHRPGLITQGEALLQDFKKLDSKTRLIEVDPAFRINSKGRKEKIPLGKALIASKRPNAPFQVYFVCHMDTVYPFTGKRITCQNIGKNVLKGPGVTDAKGGIAMMHTILSALEKNPYGKKIGWRVFINPDEEIGSLGSQRLLLKYAKNMQQGLVFEPSLPDGSLVSSRKGSGNFTLVVRGRSSHAGRAHKEGRNAIDLLSSCAKDLSELSHSREELTVNNGIIRGGTALNVVPDLAILQFNIRIKKIKDQTYARKKLEKIIDRANKKNGFKATLFGDFYAPPKAIDRKTKIMQEDLIAAGKILGMKLKWKSSGGVCDGNRLAAIGLPTIDTLGPRGENIHSHKECLYLNSLSERTKLTTIYLLELVRKGIK